MPLFRRIPGGPHGLPVAMAAVRLGERVVVVGAGSPAMLAAIAAKAGLTGVAAAVATSDSDAGRLTAAAASAGLLLEVTVAPGWNGFPQGVRAFDVAVIDGTRGWFGALPASDRHACLTGVFRALRPGGRVILIERRPSGLLGWLRPGRPPAPDYRSSGGGFAGLETAGFRPVRVLADRGGWFFVEGLRGA